MKTKNTLTLISFVLLTCAVSINVFAENAPYRGFDGHTSGVLSVAFRPDGQTIASGSYDRTILLWDANTGAPVKILTGHAGSVNSVAFSPDGQALASGSSDNTVRLWDVKTGTHLKTLTGHWSVNSVAFSPDGQTIASGSYDRTIRLWDVNTGAHLKTLTGHAYAVNSVAFSPDGKILASGDSNGRIRLWDINTGKDLQTLVHSNWVNSVAFSPDGKTLASASGSLDDTVRLWDVKTGTHLKTLTGHTDDVNSVAFSSDGQTIASGSDDETIRLWNTNTGGHIHTLTGHGEWVYSVAFRPDGQTIASGSGGDYAILLWDTNTGKPVKILAGHADDVNSVAFSPDGKILASGSGDDTIRLWNATTREHTHTLYKRRSDVRSLAFSPDGKILVSGGSNAGFQDGPIWLWDTNTGENIKTDVPYSQWVYSVAFSPDGQTIASDSGFDNTIRLWNTNRRWRWKTLTGHTGLVNSIAFHPDPDGQAIASGSSDKTIRLWDTITGENFQTLAGHDGGVNSVAFRPDGQTIASGSWDNTVRVWNATTGESIHTLTGHADAVNSVAFRPDGQTLASGSSDGTIRLWNVTTGEHLQTLVHGDHVNSVVFRPDGQTLASGGSFPTIRLWGLTSSPAVPLQLSAEVNGDGVGSIDDHGDTSDAATPLPIGESRDGVIETGTDVDYFRLEVKSRGTLTLYTTGALDTVGELEGNTINEPTRNNNSGSLNFRIEHEVSPETYYVKVTAAGRNKTGAYTLHATFTPLELVVEMPDEALAAAVRNRLGLAPDAPITRQALQRLGHLGANSPPLIKDLTGLEHATKLWSLALNSHEIHDLRPLSGLTQLRYLRLDNNQIRDVTPLKDLTLLESLNLGGNQISDVTPLAGLTLLETLYLDRNQINDVTPLKDLTLLRSLHLSGNQISDVTPLAGLTQLERLSLSDNQISDVTPLADLTQLKDLYLSENQIIDITLLSDLTQLDDLYLSDNQISDVTPLADLTQLKDLYLSGNQISDVTPLKDLRLLETLYLNENQISDVPSLAGLTQLERLYLYGNQISDVTPLKDLTQLRNLWNLHLDGNQISDVTPLADLTQLRNLRLDNNQIRDVTPIQRLIDSKNVRVRLDGNPIGEPLEGVNLVIESVTTNKTTLTPGESFTLTATLKNRGVGKAEAPIYYRWHRSTHPNIHKMGGSDKVLTGAREEIGEKRTAVRSIIEFKKTEDVSLGTNQSSKQYIGLTAPQESGTHYYSVCVESPPNESDESDNCSDTVEITVIETVIEPCDRPKVHVIWCYPNDVSPDVWVNAGRAVNIDTVPGIMTAVHDYYSKEVHRLTKKQVAFDLNYNNNGLPYEIKLSSAETELALKDFDEIYNMIIINWKHIHGEWLPDSKDFYVAIVQSQNDSLQAGGGPFSGATKGVARGNFTAVATGNYGFGIAGVNIGKGEAATQDGIAQVIAHELGHLFGLGHVFKPDNIMGYERAGTLNANHLKADHAKWIASHAAFKGCSTPSSSKTVLALPTSRYRPSWVTRPRLTGNSKTYHIGFKDPDEIYMIQLSIGVGKDQDSAVEDIEFIKMSYKSGTTVVLEILEEVLEIESNFFNSNDTVMLNLGILDKRGDVTREWYNLSNILRPLQLYQLADVDGNGKVDQEDIAFVSEIVEGTKPPDDAADVNGDGDITDADVTLVKQVIAERADIDENGKVDQEDVAFVSEIVEGTKPPDDAADVNGDGDITDADVTLVKQVINWQRKDESPAAPLQVSLLPKETALFVNYPNPFNPETWIPYQLAKPADVTLTIYDIQGRVVRDLDLGHQRAGMYQSKSRAAYWDGRNAVGESVASGVYFYTLTAGEFTATRKLLIRK